VDGRGREHYCSVSRIVRTSIFQKKDYVRARKSVEEAIRIAEEVEEYRPKENWYVLLAARFMN
jgi:hypothetical protein